MFSNTFIFKWDIEARHSSEFFSVSLHSLCAVQIKALAKIHAFVVDTWESFLLSLLQCRSVWDCVGVWIWLHDFLSVSAGLCLSRGRPTSGRSVWSCGQWVEKHLDFKTNIFSFLPLHKYFHFLFSKVPDKARVTPASSDPKSKFYEFIKVT